MRLIDTEDILVGCVKTGLKEYDTGKEAGIDLVLAIINHLPTIEAKPVVHAHWKNWGCEGTVCSNCYGRVLYECDEHEKKSKYCPHCGAQMDEVVSDTNVGSKTDHAE
jgi:hypothetical protein